MKKRYSPAVLRLAQEYDIDLNQVEGTGRGGRITRKDIEKIIAQQTEPKAIESHSEQRTVEKHHESRQTTAPRPDSSDGDVEVPVTGVRKGSAENMARAMDEVQKAR